MKPLIAAALLALAPATAQAAPVLFVPRVPVVVVPAVRPYVVVRPHRYFDGPAYYGPAYYRGPVRYGRFYRRFR